MASDALEKGKQRKAAVLAAMQAKAKTPQKALLATPQPTKRVRGKVTPLQDPTPSTKTPDAKNPRVGESAKKSLFRISSAISLINLAIEIYMVPVI